MSDALTPDAMADYLVHLGGALLKYGVPTHRLEALLTELAAKEGFTAHVFSVPTGVFLSVQKAGGAPPVQRMARVGEWSANLDRLAVVDRIATDAVQKRLTIADARTHLDALEMRAPPWPLWATVLAPGIATGAAAIFFAGNLTEAVVATVLGWVLGGLSALLRARPALRVFENFLGGAVISTCAAVATRLAPSLSREVLVLSGIIVLVPGMTLTTGMNELTHRNLVSGTARLMDAVITLVSLVLGLAVVVGIEGQFGAPVAAAEPHPGLGLAAQIVAVLLAGVGFAIRLGVPRELLPGALLSCAVAWGSTLWLSPRLPGAPAALAGAFLVTALSNAMARAAERPSRVFLLPGLVLLVPGVFAFRSLDLLLRGDTMAGAAQVGTLLLTAGALVTGLAVANVAVPSRRAL
jgi:uncharacterized membrane protein YjjP (DUF1212 family)